MKSMRLDFVKISLLVVFVVAIIFGGVIVSRNEAAASSPDVDKYYTSIEVRKGESLWSIAQDYCGDYETVGDYVDGICQINGLHSTDTLVAGRCLTVYYYK